MPASAAELVMSLFADGTAGDRMMTTDLVIDELDSWVNPDHAMAMPSIWSSVSSPPPLAVAVR